MLKISFSFWIPANRYFCTYEMQHDAAFHQDLLCLQRKKQIFMTEMHHNLEISPGNPIKYKNSQIHTYAINLPGKINRNEKG